MPRKPNYKDLLKKFKKRNIKNPERIATAYVKGLTAGSKKKLLKIQQGLQINEKTFGDRDSGLQDYIGQTRTRRDKTGFKIV